MPKRGENIYKRKDGRWEARYIKEIKFDGTKKYGSVYGKTYSEVKEKRQRFLFQATPKTKNTKITISQIMHEWLEANKNQIKITTYQKYKSAVEKYIIPELGLIQIQFLSSQTVQHFTNVLIEKGLSKTTVNDILIVLSMGLSFSEEKYGFAMPKISLLRNPQKEMRVLSVAEQNRFVKYLLKKDDIFSFGTLLALFTGLRIGELCALTWEDISENALAVNKTMQRVKCDTGTELMILPPKTASSNRLIPISQELKTTINKYRGQGYVLKQNNGKPIEPRLMQLKFKKLVDECGIKDVHFHTLRHSFATRCVEVGFDVKTLSEILGHSDVKTTLNKYVHSSMEQKTKQMDRLKFNIAI